MKRYAFYLFLLCFLIYNLNANTVMAGDTTPARLLPLAILSGRGIYLDDFRAIFSNQPYFFSPFRGHYISSYSMLVGLVSLPFYLPTFLYLKAQGSITPGILYKYSLGLEKFSASFLAALSVALFALLMYSLTHKKHTSVLWALVFGLATQTYSVSSQNLWQHGIGNLCIILSLTKLAAGLEKEAKRKIYFFVSLIFAVLAAWIRSIFLLYAIPLTLVLGYYERRSWKLFLGLLCFGCLALVGYHQYFYGTFLVSPIVPLENLRWSNLPSSLAGLLFSPARGVLFYTPFFFCGFACIFYRKKVRAKPLPERIMIGLSYLFLLAVTLVYATYSVWWAGWGWGDRFFADVAPAAVILTYYVFIFCGKKSVKLTIAAFIGYSCLTQLVGVFYFPRGRWDVYPIDVKVAQDRLWDFRDNPLLRNLIVGPNLGVLRGRQLPEGPLLPIYTGAGRKCRLELIGQENILGYTVVTVALQNLSSANWYTSSARPLELRQIYPDRESFVQSPVPSQPLPPVIQPGQKVLVRVPLVLPTPAVSEVIIAPVQEDVSWWTDYCKVEIRLSP